MSRIDFHKLLLTLTPNVYFQEPTNINIKYPAIIYKLSKVDTTNANDRVYTSMRKYEVTLIDDDPDSNLIDRLLSFKYATFDRQIIYQGITNTILNIYY